MKIRYLVVASLMSMGALLDAAPKQMQVKNGSKEIKFEIQTRAIDNAGINQFAPIKNQPSYTFKPNETKNITIVNGPGSYTAVITFIGLERAGISTLPLEVKSNTTLFPIDDAWEKYQYNYKVDFIKQMDTPEPEKHGGAWD